MKVWLLESIEYIEDTYKSCNFEGLFKTKELAEKHKIALLEGEEGCEFHNEYEITVHEVVGD